MSDNIAIKVHNVSKSFRLPHEKQNSVKGLFLSLFHANRSFEKQKVLNDINLEIKKGEFFGVVGRNGSGKSTLLKLLAGIYSPDKGSINIEGKLTPFIELGVGFSPELTGKENVYLNGALFGFNRSQMSAMYDEIVEFAELERFMDQKLKNYSSGMQVRLAFSIAIKVQSDILLLDEVLAVGDAAFQKKCFDYFRKLKRDKQTVIFISHDMNAVREYCDRAALIEGGEIINIGKSDDIAQDYTKLFLRESIVDKKDGSTRWGTNRIQINKIKTTVKDDKVIVSVEYLANEDIDNPVLGLAITSPVGVKVFESNTKWSKIKTGVFTKNSKCTAEWSVPNIFTNGLNYITVAASDNDGLEVFDWWDGADAFMVDKDTVTTAVTMPEHSTVVEHSKPNN